MAVRPSAPVVGRSGARTGLPGSRGSGPVGHRYVRGREDGSRRRAVLPGDRTGIRQRMAGQHGRATAGPARGGGRVLGGMEDRRSEPTSIRDPLRAPGRGVGWAGLVVAVGPGRGGPGAAAAAMSWLGRGRVRKGTRMEAPSTSAARDGSVGAV